MLLDSDVTCTVPSLYDKGCAYASTYVATLLFLRQFKQLIECECLKQFANVNRKTYAKGNSKTDTVHLLFRVCTSSGIILVILHP